MLHSKYLWAARAELTGLRARNAGISTEGYILIWNRLESTQAQRIRSYGDGDRAVSQSRGRSRGEVGADEITDLQNSA